MLVVVAPGQGSQRQGMLAPWLDLPVAGSRLRDASRQLGIDLAAIDRDPAGPRTYAQELLVALGHAAWGELTHDHPLRPYALAGHSVGELTVAAIGGALSPADALRVTARRAEAMRSCAAAAPGGLVAVTILGATAMQARRPRSPAHDVLAAGERQGLSLAVHNGPSQIVLGGSDDAIARFIEAQKLSDSRRQRITRLDVAGAFHTAAMEDAVPAVIAALDASPDAEEHSGTAGSPMYVRGSDGLLVDAQGLLSTLPACVASPVRWDLTMAAIADLGATGVLELPPAGTLSSLLQRAIPSLEVRSLHEPADLAEARAFADAHLAGPHPSDTPR